MLKNGQHSETTRPKGVYVALGHLKSVVRPTSAAQLIAPTQLAEFANLTMIFPHSYFIENEIAPKMTPTRTTHFTSWNSRDLLRSSHLS